MEEDKKSLDTDLNKKSTTEQNKLMDSEKLKNSDTKTSVNQEETTEEENEERIEDVVLEARFVAKQIQKLLQSDYHVFDKKERL